MSYSVFLDGRDVVSQSRFGIVAGYAKRRSPEHCRRLEQLGVSARLRAFAATPGPGSIAGDAVRGEL